MAEPRSRAQAARSYLEMLGVRPRRRRPTVDIEIGDARIEVPSEEDRALDALANAQPGRPSLDTSTTRRGEMALAADDTIPSSWMRDVQAESQGSADARAALARAQAAAEADRERRRADPGQRTRNVIAAMPPAAGDALGRLAEAPITGPLVQGLTYLPGRYLDDDTLDASLHGTTQGLTLGFADEIVGATSPYDEDYETARDRVRAQQDEAQRDAPIAYGAFEIAGSAPLSAALPTAGPGSSLLRRVLTSGAGGAGFGGVSGAGHSRHDAGTSGFRRDVIRDTAIGGAMGAGTELGMSGLSRARDTFGRRAPGAPAPGGDFTPEQWAEARRRLDAGDPSIFDDMTRREALEEEAAMRRIRSTADDAAMTDLRRTGDYPGGYRGLARNLDETGIAPRRSWRNGRAADAQARAGRVEDQAGRAIGSVRQRMDDAAMSLDPDTRIISNTDDDLTRIANEGRDRIAAQSARDEAAARAEAAALEGPTGGARGGRRRPQGVSLRDRPSDATDVDPVSFEDLNTDTPAEIDTYAREFTPREARESVVMRNDPARVRYSGTVTRLDDAGRAREVPGGTTAERLRAEANDALSAATTPEQHAEAARLSALADDMERVGPETYSQAERRLHALDEEARYGTVAPNAPDAAGRTARGRSARQGVRADMDLAVERTLGVDELRGLEGARQRYGTARAVRGLADRGSERAAGNLQAGLGDTIAVQSSLGQTGPLTERVWNAVTGVLVNRFLRSNAHALRATGQEMASDAMANAIVRRLASSQNTSPAARALHEAMRRGPRAFAVTLVALGNRDPEVQAAIAPIVLPEADYGVPTADQYEDGQLRQQPDEEPVEDVDYGVPYADEYDEQGQLRAQPRRQ